MKTTKVSRQEKLNNFLNDLLTCCAAGKEFKFNKKRKEHKISSEVSTYVKKYVVTPKKGENFKYLWTANSSVNQLVNGLTNMTLADIKARLHPAVAMPQTPKPALHKVRLETPEVVTRKEVKTVQTELQFKESEKVETVEVTAEEATKLNTKFELRLTLEKTWGKGNKESVSLPVTGFTYEQLKDQLIKNYK